MAPPGGKLRLGLALGAAVVGCGCAGRGPRRPAEDADPQGALQTPGLRGLDDPTVRGARLLPAGLGEAHVWGIEPGGAVRATVAGLRILSFPAGSLTAALGRLPANPSAVAEVPERLGGGFLMAIGSSLWRAPTWLGPAAPVFTHPAPITEIIVGLDRVYLRGTQGPVSAVDARTGTRLDLGPLPSSPRIVSFAALDAWRAAAIADLRGTLITLDAGASWRAVSLPIEPSRAIALGDAFLVGGLDRARSTQWWEVLPNGQTGWLTSALLPSSAAERGPIVPSPGLPPLGDRPLQAALEDGWPLVDGTALVARDGFLVRVRLADGTVAERVPDAFALRPARCHPLSMPRPDDASAFGFVCGEPGGRTAIFRWDAAASRLSDIRRFDAPREVLASGNGGLVVRGECATYGVEHLDDGRAFCVMNPNGRWREARLQGAGLERARPVALSSGRLALVGPPESGDISTARLTLADGDGAALRVPLRIDPVGPEVARALRFGVWMDGFEERRPGVLSGWVDAAGAVLGIQISLDGAVRVGEYISDVGGPVASGRWAFAWTGSRRGFETIDGGMSWTREISLPEPIAEPRTGRDRSCGPLGCVIAGWLRVGWGSVEDAPPVDPPPPPARPGRRPPSLTMDCARTGPQLAPDDIFANGPGGRPEISHGPVPSLRVLLHRPAGNADKFDEFTAFAGRSPVVVPAGYAGLTVEATHVLERGPRARALGRVYTWGPAAADWESSGRWQVLWLWPWQASPSAKDGTRSSAAGPPPWPTLEVARRTFGRGLGVPPDWSIVPGDDPDHALLVERRATLSTSVTGTGGGLLMLAALEADRPPVEVRPADGGPWPDLQGAVRSDGRWYIATAQRAGELAATVVWSLDGALAHEAGRVARLAPDLSTARLAARVGRVRAEGTATHVGLIVTGPDSDRGLSYWVSSFDPEERAFADPEHLTPVDLSDRGASPCGGDDDGWEIEAPFPGTVDVRIGDAWSSRLQGAVARLRVWRGGACIDDIFGAADSQANRVADAAESLTRAPPRVERSANGSATSATRTLAVTVTTDRTRVRLRCRLRSP